MYTGPEEAIAVLREIRENQKRNNDLLNTLSEKIDKLPETLVNVDKKITPICIKCGNNAEIIHGAFGTSDDWEYCQSCGTAYRVKGGEHD